MRKTLLALGLAVGTTIAGFCDTPKVEPVPKQGDRMVLLTQSAHGNGYIALDLSSRAAEKDGSVSAIVLIVGEHGPQITDDKISIAISGRAYAQCKAGKLKRPTYAVELNRNGDIIARDNVAHEWEDVDSGLNALIFEALCPKPAPGTTEL